MRSRRSRLRAAVTHRRLAAVLALCTGVLVLAIGFEVFPYLTTNHDEGVYLQQAAMLLSGKLHLRPPVVESFRPWFFVVDGQAMYPKYTPVPAAIFALGGLVGAYRLALGVVAAAAVALTYAVVTEVFDETTGLVAALLLVGSPLFLVDASVFLPYVPTFCLNLLFAWAYLRADRTGNRRFAALAGGAIGLAFFARPYTAVLFATPFVAHALWTLRELDRDVLRRQATTAALGLAGVAVALGYNAAITGDPLVFPYQAFAPLDGLGFGRREILGYEETYSVSLALEANARVLWAYLTGWSVAAPLGSLAAVFGLGWTLARQRLRPDPRALALGGLAVTIPLGNVYFWGNRNILQTLSNPNDGLISFLGPYYHVGLLLPTVAFAAVAVVGLARRLGPRLAGLDKRYRLGAGVAVVLALALVSTLAVGAVAAPLSDNYDVTGQYEQAYEPFESASFENALVFLPDPYGPWLNHPFQTLRNDPGYDGDAVYALEHRQFAVVDAFPDRTLYRYSYNGQWQPYSRQAVTPHLREIRLVEGERVTNSLAVGLPDRTAVAEVRVSSGKAGESASVKLPADELQMRMTVTDGQVRAASPNFDGPLTVPLTPDEPVKTTVYLDYGSLGGFEYVSRLPVERTDDTYRALSPRLEVCRVPTNCNGEAAYVPGTHRPGVWMNATLSTEP